MIHDLIGAVLLPRCSDFSWFHLLPGIGDGALGHALHLAHAGEAFTVPAAWTVVVLTLGLALLGRAGLRAALAREGAEKYVPDATLTPRNALELFVGTFYELMEGVLGKKDAPIYFPLVATLFCYVLASNLIGLLPGMLPPTEIFSHNAAMAICVFLVFNYVGLQRNGFAYIKHLGGTMPLMFPFLFFIELFGLLIRPFTLSLRLAANMYADHLVVGVSRELGGTFLGAVGSVLVPIPFYGLGLFVCLIQAFVFSLLTAIYIALAAADMRGHHH